MNDKILFPSPVGGVQHPGGGIHQRVADGGGNVAAALAPHGDDGGHAVGGAHLKQPLLALHHVHKAHRHPDDQRRAQPGGFDQVGNGQQRRGIALVYY